MSQQFPAGKLVKFAKYLEYLKNMKIYSASELHHIVCLYAGLSTPSLTKPERISVGLESMRSMQVSLKLVESGLSSTFIPPEKQLNS